MSTATVVAEGSERAGGSRRRRPPGPIPGARSSREEAPAVASDADEPASAEIPDEVAVESADEPADAMAERSRPRGEWPVDGLDRVAPGVPVVTGSPMPRTPGNALR